MADPRATVDFEGIAAKRETFAIDNSTITFDSTKNGGSAQVGLAVMTSANNTVALTQDASVVTGRLERVEPDGMCVVQTHGGVTLAGGLSATLTPGSRIVGALGASSARGYIRSVAGATAAEDAVARGEIRNSATATAVQVMLD
jgi:hypothetical protein